MPGVFFHA
jgi:hypothetical protein